MAGTFARPRGVRPALTASLCIALATIPAGAQTPSAGNNVAPLSGGAVAGQVTTGVLGTAVGFFGGGLGARWVARKFGADEDASARTAYAGAYTGAVLLAAAGPALIGNRGNARGSYPAAVAGAAAGGIVSALIKRIGDRGALGERGPVAVVAGIAIAILPSVGATIAYNSTR